MKKSRICLLIIFLLAVSCSKSRFATTSRHFHDGKVTYTNHYSSERMKLNLHKIKAPATHTRDVWAKTAGNPVENPETINKMDLIASSGKNILILNNREKQISPYMPGLHPEFHNEKELAQSKHTRNPLTKNLTTVRFKEISHGDSTIVEKRDNNKEHAAGIEKTDHPKTETLGLVGFILSFFGIIPLIGIPFAVVAIIFGAKSLTKINRNPKKYKGKGFAIASMVIGFAMIVVNIVYIASAVSSVANTPAPTLNTSSTSCKV